MSGWSAYVDTQLVATGAVTQAAIYGKGDMQCYANAGDFQLRAYNAQKTNEDGSVSDIAVNEAADWLAFVTQGTKPSAGFRTNGFKIQVLREMEGPTIMFVKSSPKGGGCIAVTNTLVIFGVWEEGQCAGTLAQCNQAVEALAEYLRTSGY